MSNLKSIGLVVILQVLSIQQATSQIKQDYDYTSEIIWGINKNTNGGLIGGFILKYGREINNGFYETFGLELSNVKHPKEQRTQTANGSTFIWGKQNYLYAVRFQYGREKIIFKKAPQQGVQINALLAAGPTLGFVTPYYISIATGPFESQSVPFDPQVHTSQRNIIGTGRLFEGLGDASVKIGANAKAALNFEFGTFKRAVTGFELGFMLEAYTEDIIIVPEAENRSIFPSAFITLFYGSRK